MMTIVMFNLFYIYFSFYEALIEEVSSDNLKVKFDGYTTLEVVSIDNVKPIGGGVKRPLSGDESKYVTLHNT